MDFEGVLRTPLFNGTDANDPLRFFLALPVSEYLPGEKKTLGLVVFSVRFCFKASEKQKSIRDETQCEFYNKA